MESARAIVTQHGLCVHCLLGLILPLLPLFPLLSQAGEILPVQGLPNTTFSISGDLNIGVVMSLHSYDESSLCGDVIRELGALQRLESIAFAVEEINNCSDLLPNVTLGFTVLDDCYNDLTALVRALQFVQKSNETDMSDGESSLPAVSAVAVVGAEGSPRTLQMADVFSVFRVPLLSYASSSSQLDDKIKFSYFSRIVPSDNMQAKAIVDILLAFNWTYVSIVYADGSYGTEGFRAIQNHLERNGYCVAITHMVKNTFQELQYNETIHKLLSKPQARVVVLFTTQAQALKLFEAVNRVGVPDNFTWVGGDSIGMNPHIFATLEHIVNGIISVNFVSAPVERFEDHFSNMTLKTGSRNPWFGEFFADIFNCSLNEISKACNDTVKIGTSGEYKPESTASQSMNAIYALAHALDEVMKNCSQPVVADCVEPSVLRDTLRKVSFQGEGLAISFDNHGNGQTSYDVRNMVVENGVLVQNMVGNWDTATGNFSYLNKSLISWKKEFLDNSPTRVEDGMRIPVSVCSQPCPGGQQAVVTQPSCCFYCEACRENERTVARYGEFPKCERCPKEDNFTWPDDETRTECFPLSPSYLHIGELEGILVLALDIIVFFITLAVTFFYLKNGDSRLIKASSQELCVMMLVGHVLTCVLVGTFVLEPTQGTCIVTNSGFHVSFTLSYAPLLVKTNRIYRIFGSGKKSTKLPPFVSSRSQVVFAVIIIALQLILIVLTTAHNPPKAFTAMANLSERLVTRECSVPQAGFLACITFNIVLMALCAVQAFKTRALPANFNETKFITFSIYTTILLWLSFFPTYFTARSYTVKALCLAVALLFNVLSGQLFLFLPKLYALYYVSEAEMNVRKNARSQVAPSEN